MRDGFPLPPSHLIRRAGVPAGVDPLAHYLAVGAANKQMIVELDPVPVWFDGRRVLDFGCGAGKVLRHFATEAARGEVCGCDIDDESVRWLGKNLCPPFRLFEASREPSLPVQDEYFDLIYAISVFTHIAENWAAWLLELHRTLKPDGVAIVTVLGEGMIEMEHGGPWDPDQIGMNVLRMGQDWDGGGPTVFHSDWWIRAHWGRAFEIVDIHHERNADGDVHKGSHAFVVMRKRSVALGAAALDALEPGEPRELAALAHNIEQLHEDDRRLRTLLRGTIARSEVEHAARAAAEARLSELMQRLETMKNRRSSRLIRPLRKLYARTRQPGQG